MTMKGQLGGFYEVFWQCNRSVSSTEVSELKNGFGFLAMTIENYCPIGYQRFDGCLFLAWFYTLAVLQR